MIVPEQLVQEVDRLGAHQVLVVSVDKFAPGLAAVAPDEALKVRIELDPVLAQVRGQLVRAEIMPANMQPRLHMSSA